MAALREMALTSAPAAPAATASATQPQPRKLRVGVLADGPRQPRWLIEAFAKVAASEFAEIVMLGFAPGEKGAGKPPALLDAYSRFDRWAFAAGPAELGELAPQVAHQRLLAAPAPARLIELQLDVLFVVGALDDSAYDGVARHGVWRFCFGPEHRDAEALAGWREVAEDAPTTGSGIRVRLSAGAPPRLAYESWSRTYPLSVARNRDQLLAKTSEFAWRALRELQRSGPGWLEQCRLVRENRGQAPISNGDVLQMLPSLGARLLKRGVEKALNVEQWFIAFRFTAPFTATAAEGRAIPDDLSGYTRILPPKDRLWADPFAIEKDARHYVFFEEMPFAGAKGYISMLEIRRDGSWSAPVKVLERDYHLSYPFLLEHGGELYMIPETAQNRAVEIYRCIDFPLRWKLERPLIDGVRLVDATFHRGADQWWMFANASTPSWSLNDELHLFHADDLLGTWRPHARNPIKSDVRCARPAGNLFWRGGALYRPAQICAPHYGAGLSINRVLRLTPHDYAERQVERVLPAASRGLMGIHTVNRAGDLTVIDACALRRRFA